MNVARLKYNFNKILLMMGVLILFALFEAFIEWMLLKPYGFYTNGEVVNIPKVLTVNTVYAILGGLLLGIIEVFYLKKRLRKKSFAQAITIRSISYSLSIFLLILLGSFTFNSAFSGASFFSLEVLSKVHDFLSGTTFSFTVTYWILAAVAMLLALQFNERYSNGAFHRIFIGRYHRPREEERIFMFLDIQSSTGIAEQMGHKNFFRFLNNFYQDITDPILYNKGEIYQYVGDEIVISWKLQNGIKNAHCIKCFFDIEAHIQSLASTYIKKFNRVPEFKAGVHSGKVTAGEMGEIKRDIVFTGDVLNTSARIRSVCNAYQEPLLISEHLYELLHPNKRYKFRKIEEIKLKGKKKKVTLFSVRKKETKPKEQKAISNTH